MSNTDRIAILRRATASALRDRFEQGLIGFEEISAGTFESPIEHQMFYGILTALIERGEVIAFFGRSEYYECCIKNASGEIFESFKGEVLGLAERSTDHAQLNMDNAQLFGLAANTRDLTNTLISQCGFGEYRLDFFLKSSVGFVVGIECDGHDFHERTKEQARRDRGRDRTMLTDGLPVLRFTGSEIFADALSCGREVVTYLDRVESRHRWGHD